MPLRRGVIGPEAARLLGSLVVAELWQAAQARSAIAPSKRHPVMVYVDEVQDYLALPTDLGDALAQARSYGVGFTLAHQFLGQLPRAMREAVLANARSRVCFQLPHEDAAVLARGHGELSPVDFTSLGRYEVYASLFAGGQVTPYASGKTLPLPDATSDGQALTQAQPRTVRPAAGRPGGRLCRSGRVGRRAAGRYRPASEAAVSAAFGRSGRSSGRVASDLATVEVRRSAGPDKRARNFYLSRAAI